MRHFLFIDPLEKLVIEKDSTLLQALTFKAEGEDVFLLFEKDFFTLNQRIPSWKVWDFTGKLKEGGPYLSSFKLTSSKMMTPAKGDIFHMRLDPPFDARYLKYLWMLQGIEKQGITILNSPRGILLHNEKLYPYQKAEWSLPTYIGESLDGFLRFREELLEMNIDQVIFKPLDLYQGAGVTKAGLTSEGEAKKLFQKQVKDFHGATIVQPFYKEIAKGEIRSFFFRGHELASILKVPPADSFLANIARGAKYEKVELTPTQKQRCLKISEELAQDGCHWLAFDLLGDYLSEVNVTCPGLLVELSQAAGKNLSLDMLKLLKS